MINSSTNMMRSECSGRCQPSADHALELFDEPARIINADIELIVRRSQEGASQLAQLTRRGSGEFCELPAAPLIDQAILEVDPDLRVSALEESLDLAEEGFVHRRPIIARTKSTKELSDLRL